MGRIDFVEEPPEAVIISNGIAIAAWPDGSRRAIPLNVFRLCVSRCQRAIAEHDARNAEVVPFRRKVSAEH